MPIPLTSGNFLISLLLKTKVYMCIPPKLYVVLICDQVYGVLATKIEFSFLPLTMTNRIFQLLKLLK